MVISIHGKLINGSTFLPSFPSSMSSPFWKEKKIVIEMNKLSLVRAHCAPLQQEGQTQQQLGFTEDMGIMCEPCNGCGWLLCDFCKGQKTNVKAENNRIYLRCPSCRAIGYVLCSNCKVFKCVTYPDYDDGEL